MAARLPAAGLYAITDSTLLAPDRLVASVDRALAGGAVMVQYRDKTRPADARYREAAALAELCRGRGVPLIVNDDIALARAAGADGVHLGREDAPVAEARRVLGEDAIIGASCYNRLDLARQAETAGASYVAFGRFFPSATKPDAMQAGTGLLAAARRESGLPIAAIGGITPENARGLIDAGAGLLAVIHGVFGQADIEAAARRYSDLFSNPPAPG